MLNNGVPLIVVSNRLGHSKPSITMDVYGHLHQETQIDAAKIMDDLVIPIKLDMREFETHDAVKGRNVVHISEYLHRKRKSTGLVDPLTPIYRGIYSYRPHNFR